jgi:hypothetical protein
MHLITLKTFYTNSDNVSELPAEFRVIDSREVSVEAVTVVAAAWDSDPAQEIDPPTPTPKPEQPSTTDAGITVNSIELEPVSEATPEPRLYPPPPPAPGVPYGPTQEQMSPFGPPVCDAAKYLGAYVAPTNQRVMIEEPDAVPARTAGGSTVFRAWKLQNIGTCTWGTNYELAFYGGRQMGSGGVAFESFFPSEPPRSNTIVNDFQLIVPEGKPNQTAVLEVMLQAPVIPGIHQSYWRMRNPQGVYFGPIMGVTLETVRECTHGTYGAPVINRFEIVGCPDPTYCVARQDQNVYLDYSVSNTTNFDIVIVGPTGNSTAVSSGDNIDRIPLSFKEEGKHTVTMFADNGSCTVTAEVIVYVIAGDSSAFDLDVALSAQDSAAAAPDSIGHVTKNNKVPKGSVAVQWNHVNPEISQFDLVIKPMRLETVTVCPKIGGMEIEWEWLCTTNVVAHDYSDQQAASAGISNVTEISMAQTLGEAESSDAALVNNGLSYFCPSNNSGTNIVRYVMYAYNDQGQPAQPVGESNAVDIICAPSQATEILEDTPVSTPTP